MKKVIKANIYTDILWVRIFVLIVLLFSIFSSPLYMSYSTLQLFVYFYAGYIFNIYLYSLIVNVVYIIACYLSVTFLKIVCVVNLVIVLLYYSLHWKNFLLDGDIFIITLPILTFSVVLIIDILSAILIFTRNNLIQILDIKKLSTKEIKLIIVFSSLVFFVTGYYSAKERYKIVIDSAINTFGDMVVMSNDVLNRIEENAINPSDGLLKYSKKSLFMINCLKNMNPTNSNKSLAPESFWKAEIVINKNLSKIDTKNYTCNHWYYPYFKE